MDEQSMLIKLLNEAIERRVNNALRQRKLTLVQVWILRSLNQRADKTYSFKELESILNVAQSTCAGTINRIVAKGFVECFTNPEDRRIKLVRLTETGEKYVKDVEQEINNLNDTLYSGLSTEEIDTFFSLLQRMYDNIK